LEGQQVAEARIPMFGDYNIENALGALALVHRLGVPLDDAAAALAHFEGVRRRQELRGEVGGVSVIDDFAHHPTAVRETIRALRERFPERRLIAAFEPRSNTSRRALFQEAYVDALRDADRVFLAHVPPGPLYSATGEVTEFFDARRAVDALRENDCVAEVHEGAPAIAEAIARCAEPGDVVLVMSNGDFDGLCQRLLDALAA
jgi:UDP-N-acetylmuramate: L-alanyl-gamma-D-glutamyl-meso-diaminopimelate ligase